MLGLGRRKVISCVCSGRLAVSMMMPAVTDSSLELYSSTRPCLLLPAGGSWPSNHPQTEYLWAHHGVHNTDTEQPFLRELKWLWTKTKHPSDSQNLSFVAEREPQPNSLRVQSPPTHCFTQTHGLVLTPSHHFSPFLMLQQPLSVSFLPPCISPSPSSLSNLISDKS